MWHQSGREWLEEYETGILSDAELVEGIIYCAKFEAPAELLALLNHDLRARLLTKIRSLRHLKSDDELQSIGTPPPWTLADAKRFEQFIDE